MLTASNQLGNKELKSSFISICSTNGYFASRFAGHWKLIIMSSHELKYSQIIDTKLFDLRAHVLCLASEIQFVSVHHIMKH